MGKKTQKRMINSDICPEAAATEQQTPFPLNSPFCSSLVSIQVGNPPQLFQIHSEVLSQAPSLHARARNQAYYCPWAIPDVTVSTFDLVIRYLYGAQFESWRHALTSRNDSEAQHENSLQPACEVLCFALTYDIQDLQDEIASYLRGTQEGFRSVLRAAKYVYSHAPRIEPWFRQFIHDQTTEALADSSTANEAWFLETFEHGYNGLGRVIFECFKNLQRAPNESIASPASEILSVSSFDELVQDDQQPPCPDVPASAGKQTAKKEPALEETELCMPTHGMLRGDVSAEDTVEDIEECMVEEAPPTIPEESCSSPKPVLEAEIVENSPWDLGLNSKERRKKRREMEAQGIIFDVFGEPIYPVAEPEPEPEPTPWDYGLNSKERRKKKKEMQAQGICFDAFDRPIYPVVEPGPETEQIIDPEPELRMAEEKPLIVSIKYEQTNFCTQRQYHLQQSTRWQTCNDCMREVNAMAHIVSDQWW